MPADTQGQETRMRDMLRLISLAIAIAFAPLCGAALAQAPVKQVKLTEKQVQSFIEAQKDLTAITDKMEGSVTDKPDPKVQADLEAAAKKHGFKDFAEYDDVAANISM